MIQSIVTFTGEWTEEEVKTFFEEGGKNYQFKEGQNVTTQNLTAYGSEALSHLLTNLP